MYTVENLTTAARQKQVLVMPDGTSISITLYYMPLHFGWFITELIYLKRSFQLSGFRIVNSPNMLHQYRNKIPFGLACFTEGDREPTQLEDFESGAAKLYILDAKEVEQYLVYLNG